MPYKFNPFTETLDEVGTGSGGGATNLNGLTDVTITAPSAWQVLGYNTTSGEWENTSHIHGSLAGSLYIHIKNTDSVQLDKGTPFYITGTVGASDQVEVQAADNTDPAKGPAVGLVEEDLIVNGEGDGVLVGEIFNYDTATPGWSTNDALYVSTAGTITNVKPSTGYRQVVGYVGRVHALTGTIIVLGNQADPVAGSNGQIQFNDDGGFGADAALTFNKTTDELRLAGDINLDSGGTYSTTIQSVTPTANRTISFPDQTGTVGLVSGATGNIQYNNAGQLAGTGDLNTELDWVSPTGIYTALKVNADSNGGNDGTLLDLQVDGDTKFYVSSSINSKGIGIGDIGPNNTPRNGFVLNAGLGLIGNNSSSIAAGAISVLIRRGTGALLNDTEALCFGNTNTLAIGTRLYQDAANILAQRNGTNAQTYRLYNTYTDASNYQRTSINDDSTGLIINQEYAGTGALRTNLLDLQNNGASVFVVTTNAGIGIGGAPSTSYNLYNPSNTFLTIRRGTTEDAQLTGSDFTIRSGSIFAWSSTSQASAAADIALARDSAGVVAITDGSTGTGYLRQVPITVASLPTAAAGNAGTRIFVSDASVVAAGNFGSVVVGGGANTVPVYSDGGAWRIG